MQNFLDSFKDKLGPRAEQIIAEDRDTIGEQRRRLKEAEKQLQQAGKLAAQREAQKRELEALRSKVAQTGAQIDAIQDEQGSNLDSEAELRRLKQQKKSYQTEKKEKSFGFAHKKSDKQRKGTSQG